MKTEALMDLPLDLPVDETVAKPLARPVSKSLARWLVPVLVFAVGVLVYQAAATIASIDADLDEIRQSMYLPTR